MDMEKLQTLLLQTAEVLEQFRRQSEQASQRHHQSGQQLQQLADTVPTILRNAADGSFSALAAQIRQEIGRGLGQTVDGVQQAMQEAGQQLSRSSDQSRLAAGQLDRVSRALWLSTACSIVLLMVAAGAGAWLSSHYYDEIRRNQISADLLRAYDAADVTLCDGALCANVDVSARGVGSEQQYRPVRPRKP